MATMRDVIISAKDLKAYHGKKNAFSGVTLSGKLGNFLSLLTPAFIWITINPP